MLIAMKVLKRVLVILILILISVPLGACGVTTPATLPTSTQTMPATAIFTPELIASMTASLQPTIQFAITANPDQLARWKEYEHALASQILYTHPPEEILCEWEILGQSELVVYVWAFCLGLPPAGRGEEYVPRADIPAVIHLGSDGSVQSVEIPGYSSSYAEGIRRLFPKDVQERIFSHLFHYAELTDHAKARRENPVPPLIVLLATPQP